MPHRVGILNLSHIRVISLVPNATAPASGRQSERTAAGPRNDGAHLLCPAGASLQLALEVSMDLSEPARSQTRTRAVGRRWCVARNAAAMWVSVAPSWRELAERVGTREAVVTQAMQDSAGRRRRHGVLDLACGPGAVGMAAAAVVGPDGEVVLSDVVPEMTAIAAYRAKTPDLQTSQRAKGTSSGSTNPESAFGAVLCREGLTGPRSEGTRCLTHAIESRHAVPMELYVDAHR